MTAVMTCPPYLEPLRGIFAPKLHVERTWESAEARAQSQSLSDSIDSIGWDEWGIEDDPRMIFLGETDGCGCVVYKWADSGNSKSVTLHSDCRQGNGAHIWSGTMRAELGLEAEHLSRLDLSAAMRGVTRAEAARAVGLPLGQRLDYDAAGVTPMDLEADAAGAEARGDLAAAERNREAARVMQAALDAQREKMLASGRYFERPVPPEYRIDGQVSFAPAAGTPLPVVDEAGNPVAGGGQLAVLPGLPAVDPRLAEYAARAAQRPSPEPPLNHAAGYARGMLPADLRPLREAVRGPRASAAPVDVEFSHGLLAEAVAVAVGGSKLRCLPDGKRWYSWAGVSWSDADQGAARAAVQGLLSRHRQGDAAVGQRKIRAYAWKTLSQAQRLRLAKMDGYRIDEAGELVGPDGAAIEMILTESAREAESTPAQNAIIAQLASMPEVSTPITEFDAHPGVIGTPTGYVVIPDPQSGRAGVALCSPNPDLLVTKLFGASFVPGAKCPMWERAMEQSLPNRETRRYLQTILGQALFGRQDEHLLVVFEGDGGNGKGFTVDVLRAIFGDYAADLMVSVFTLAGMGNHATEKMPFKGARIAFTDEIPPQQLNMDMVKKTTGGGTLAARGVNENQTDFDLTHLQVFLTNNRLQWPPSAMAAVRRRMRVFRFEVEFGSPGAPPKISGLDARIIAEESAGVLNWLLEGYSIYLDEGLEGIDDAPEQVREWTAATLAESSTWAAFCAMAFEVTDDDADFIESATVFPVWDKFRADDTDQRHASPGSARVVGGMLAQQVLSLIHI